MSGTEKEDKKNKIVASHKKKSDNLFSVKEKEKKDLTDTLFQRVKKNPDPKVVKELLELLDVIEDDHSKGRYYKRERASAYHRITLEEVSVELKSFQNRKTEYSKYSVQGIMVAVFSDEFKKALLNPCILRQNPEGKNVILAGHSRSEAFYRLSMIYQDKMHELSQAVQEELHELCKMYKYEYNALPYMVQMWCKKHDYNFDKLPCLFIHNLSFNQAQTIAMMSNALATVETDVERANVYRCMRGAEKTNHEIDLFGRRCEKNNRPRIKAYSYLNPNGLAITSLERFESNQDESHVIKRIAKWIGYLRQRHQNLSNLHEDELFDRLFDKGGYGTRKDQISSQSQFEKIMTTHIEHLEKSDKLHPDHKLNVLKIQSLSYAMQQYQKLLKEIKAKKLPLYTQFHTTRRNINKQIVKKTEQSDVDALREKLYQIVAIPDSFLAKLEKVEDTLFDVKEFINEENADQVRKGILDCINALEYEYYRLKNKKDRHINEGKKEIAINFASDQVIPEEKK